MKVDILFPALPPALDGIGDHTSHFARRLASHATVRVLTAQKDALPIPGVSIQRAFATAPRSSINQVLNAVRTSPPDVLLVEFNQFSYGRWGLNPHLPWLLQSIERHLPSIRIAWMAHEDMVPGTSWKNRVMRLWQQRQFLQIGRAADVIFFSIQPWVQQYGSWFPETPVYQLPVGSNMPHLGISQQSARQELGISPDTFVVGLFGTMHASRMLPLVRDSVQALYNRIPDRLQVLYVGPDGDTVRDTLGSLPLTDAGRLPADEVSVHLTASDLHLAPFIDGMSARRGSVLAALQHGLPVVSTVGPLTDPFFRAVNGASILLAPVHKPRRFVEHVLAAFDSSDRRIQMGRSARRLYETHLSFDVAIRTFLRALKIPAAHEDRAPHAVV